MSLGDPQPTTRLAGILAKRNHRSLISDYFENWVKHRDVLISVRFREPEVPVQLFNSLKPKANEQYVRNISHIIPPFIHRHQNSIDLSDSWDWMRHPTIDT